MDCHLPGPSVRGILQAGILELPFPSPGHLPNPGVEPRAPASQVDSLQSLVGQTLRMQVKLTKMFRCR